LFHQEWADQLFRLSHNSRLKNLSSLECLEKIHSKIIHGLINSNKSLPVQRYNSDFVVSNLVIISFSLIQYLCRNNRDINKETKIRQALEYVKIPCQTVRGNLRWVRLCEIHFLEFGYWIKWIYFREIFWDLYAFNGSSGNWEIVWFIVRIN